MRLPLVFLVAFACAIAAVFVGGFLVRNPERVYRIVSFGEDMKPSERGRFRAIGWFYVFGGAFTALMFLGTTLLVLLHS